MANLLPLEARLECLAKDQSSFPDRTVDYFARYLQIKDWMTKNVYRDVQAGLAMEGVLYTQHDLEHVEDVIASAGKLLGLSENKLTPSELPYTKLAPYEVYVILVAILLHDAGNAEGREGHEKRCKAHLVEMGPGLTGGDTLELRHIGSVAAAHGGKLPNGDKDTISKLLPRNVEILQNNVELRPRLVAGLVRLADEISEGPSRSNKRVLKNRQLSPLAVVHNLYCQCVRISVDLRNRSITTAFEIEVTELTEKFRTSASQEEYLVDYIAQRLEKCHNERIYCQRFFSEVLTLDSIRVEASFIHKLEVVDSCTFTIRDEGYPSSKCDPSSWGLNGLDRCAWAKSTLGLE